MTIRPVSNLDPQVVHGFGDEWSRFDQSALTDGERQTLFESYFRIFPWEALPTGAAGFDAGCGSGRWASLVAPRVGRLVCVDASAAALAVARRNLAGHPNCELQQASIDDMPIDDASMDFGYSLGVLHHMPDTAAAIRSCAVKLKTGAPFLLYLYYAFDHRPAWFRLIWRMSEIIRRVLSRTPYGVRYLLSQVLAAIVYWPLARGAKMLERVGFPVQNVPLSFYRDRSFYVMRTDALDRFGTRLEQRFTRDQIENMLRNAGLEHIRISDSPPFWSAVGWKGGPADTPLGVG